MTYEQKRQEYWREDFIARCSKIVEFEFHGYDWVMLTGRIQLQVTIDRQISQSPDDSKNWLDDLRSCLGGPSLFD